MYRSELPVNGLSECIEISSQRKIVTEALPVSREIVRSFFKKDGWYFNWRDEYKNPDRHVFYLRTCTEDRRVQGLISATPMLDDKFIFLHLIEKAPHNMGPERQYENISDCLIAYMCKASFELGMEGYVSFVAKNALINYYIKRFGAELVHPRQNKMFINSQNALKLVNLYIKNI